MKKIHPHSPPDNSELWEHRGGGPYLGLHHGNVWEAFLEEGKSKCHTLNKQRALSNQERGNKGRFCDQ